MLKCKILDEKTVSQNTRKQNRILLILLLQQQLQYMLFALCNRSMFGAIVFPYKFKMVFKVRPILKTWTLTKS